MIEYVFQVLIFQLVFLVFYDLFLSKLTFFKANRLYILLVLGISFVIPTVGSLISSSISDLSGNSFTEFQSAIPEINLMPDSSVPIRKGISLNSIVLLIYGFGFFIASLRFTQKLFSIWKLYRSGKVLSNGRTVLVMLDQDIASFSFFKYIFISSKEGGKELDLVLDHERIHYREYHSVDKMVLELIKVVFWFNPLIYLFQNRIDILHEYQTDSSLTQTHKTHDYINILLEYNFKVQDMSIVNSFYKESQIKKRIKMLTKNNSKVIHKLKYIAILPLVFVMMFISSCTSQEQDEAESVVKSKELDKTSRVEEVDDDIPFSIVQEVPVYPGCENRTNEEKKACLNKSMQNFVSTEFDSNLVKNLGLEPGNKRIFALFKIDIDGNVVDIRVRAPHKDLEKEAIRTIQNLPQMQPGKSEGKAVGVKYVLPIVFKVE
jgi:hypothetical protein